jgi:hypothetical protein
VLRPGAKLGIYDLMRLNRGDLAFPLPWASSAATSFVASPDSYEASLAATGFEVLHTEDRTSAVLDFMIEAAQRAESGDGPPPLGLHLLMGPDAGSKLINLVASLENGVLAPYEMIAATPSK